ncbi:hypothetical protein H0H81_007254 [Sphagnurus paluster]|uniref:Uncharacterized protein n=1 Tax=Sphagnurus paluster TaxID=117069 RepID=A0A9P7FSV3_9AGAR|nr:hypothetical protein H0H81_007254 [Sphagnurus paluster]
MKRGFLNQAKARPRPRCFAQSQAVDPATPKPFPAVLSDNSSEHPEEVEPPTGKANRPLPKGYQPMANTILVRGLGANTVNYPSDMHIFTTLPPHPIGATVADNRDN